jgi:hypothetical protein
MFTTWNVLPDLRPVTLPLEAGGEYDFVEDWGDGQSSRITQYDQQEIQHQYLVSTRFKSMV